MGKPEDLDQLAQRYLDLFEAEDSAAAADPVLGEALDKITRAWVEAAQAGWALAPRVWNAAGGGAAAGATGAGRAGEGKSNDSRAAYGAAPPAAAPGSGTGELAALHTADQPQRYQRSPGRTGKPARPARTCRRARPSA